MTPTSRTKAAEPRRDGTAGSAAVEGGGAATAALAADDEQHDDAPTGVQRGPSLSALSAIVDEVRRQKEQGPTGIGEEDGGVGSAPDLHAIALREVHRYYDVVEDDGDGGGEEGWQGGEGRVNDDGDDDDEVSDDEVTGMKEVEELNVEEFSADLSLTDDGAGGLKRSHPWDPRRGDEDCEAATAQVPPRSPSIRQSGDVERGSGSAAAAGVFDDIGFEEGGGEVRFAPQSHPYLYPPSRRRGALGEIFSRRYSAVRQVLRSRPCRRGLVVACLVAVALALAGGVAERLRKRSEGLSTHWDVTVAADASSAAGAEGASATEAKAEEQDLPPDEDLEALSYALLDAYHPAWFDRETGWKGTTFAEAMTLCEGHDEVPCPYQVYCPGKAGRLIFDDVINESNNSWAPVLDDWNEWVQIGKGKNLCAKYSETYGRRPEWGSTPGSGGLSSEEVESMTTHIMCCLEHPLRGEDVILLPEVPAPPDVVAEHGDGVEDPIPPPPPPHVAPGLNGDTESIRANDDQITHAFPTEGYNNATSPDVSESSSQEVDLVMAPMHSDTGSISIIHADEHHYDDQITAMKKILNPTWYNGEVDGWVGGSHSDAIDFCHLKGQELCPFPAYCPYGNGSPVLEGAIPTRSGEPLDQWAPSISRPNQWVLLFSLDRSRQCVEYERLNNGEFPSWGLDRSMPEIKNHILCCSQT